MYSEILENINSNKTKLVKEQLIDMQVQDIADLLEEIEKPKDLLKVMLKELIVGLLLGLTISIACFGKIMLIDGLLFKTPGVDYASALIISLAMLITIVLAKIVGCMLPILAKQCKLDPAVMASPFITTILDTLSMLIYCALALTFLH